MNASAPRTTTGLLGPVVVSAGVLLLLAAPIMRGGNRYLGLIPLELLGLAVLVGIWLRWLLLRPRFDKNRPSRQFLLLLIASSPAVLALAQLTPLPANIWSATPGREVYRDALNAIGAAGDVMRPLSLAPSATVASLLAGIPLAAAMLLGAFASLSQLRLMFWAIAAMAFCQVLLGLLQIAGGQFSALFFGVLTFGPPVGSFANRNHFANYLAMALAAYVWLAFESLHDRRSPGPLSSFTTRHQVAIWVAGGTVLVLGILMSRSRGGALFGLPAAGLALACASLRLNGLTRGLRLAAGLLAVLVAGAAGLLGFDALTSRVSVEQLASSAGFRTGLARTSFEGAMAFWPWGSGWGTYDVVYPRFQPSSLPGFANHAHMDYVEMLFEGGIFFIVLAGAFAWTAAQRALRLASLAIRHRRLERDAMAAVICGCGLLALLAHSLVEFNMRIPANAILGALLAGAFLRPLSRGRSRRSVASPHAGAEHSSGFDSQLPSGYSSGFDSGREADRAGAPR